MINYESLSYPEYLTQRYTIDGLSAKKIGKEIGCSQSSIFRDLKKLDIPRRLQNKDIDNLVLTIENKKIIDGLMLGDGCIHKLKKRNPRLEIQQCEKNKDLVQFLHDKLCPNIAITYIKPRQYFNIKLNRTINGTGSYSCCLHSKQLIDIYNKWYPNGKKNVPLDLELTPIAVLHWFMGDGSTSYIKNQNGIKLTLCTNGFIKEEAEFLNNLCEKYIGFEFNIYKDKRSKKEIGYFLQTAKKDNIEQFLDYIGPCPTEIPSMQYKWKYPIYKSPASLKQDS